jgi:hypothetical protein
MKFRSDEVVIRGLPQPKISGEHGGVVFGPRTNSAPEPLSPESIQSIYDWLAKFSDDPVDGEK